MPVAVQSIRIALRAPDPVAALRLLIARPRPCEECRASSQLALWVVTEGSVVPWCRPLCSEPDCLRAAARSGSLCEAHKKRKQRGQPLSLPVVQRPASALSRLHEAALGLADAEGSRARALAEDVLRKAALTFGASPEAAVVAPGAGTLDALRSAAEGYAGAESDRDWKRADRALQAVAVGYLAAHT